MKKKVKFTTSLSKDFWLFISLIVFSVVFLTLAFSGVIYKSYINKKIDSLPHDASRIEYVLTDSIQYIENYAQFIGQRIAEHGADDLDYIAGLIGGKANTVPNPQNLFIYTLFDWVTPDKKMWVSSKKGVFKEPIDMAHRSYLNYTEKYPWKLQTQAPAVGIPSGQWIIPGGFGITNADGEYLGALTLGFAIDGIAKKINAAIGRSDIEFVILTKNLEYVGGTLGGGQADDKYFFSRVIKENNEELKKSGFLNSSIMFKNAVYPYYQKTPKYDYIILTGYNKSLPGEIFDKILLPRILEFFVLGLMVVVILLIFRRRIIRPLIALSEAADGISKGKNIKKVPRSNVSEIQNLSKQLVLVMRYIKRENRYKNEIIKSKQKIEELMQIHKDYDEEKEAFLRDMYHMLNTPLNAIINGAEIARNEMLGPLDLYTYGEYFEAMYDAGMQLKCFTTDFIYPEQIDIAEVIKSCVKIQKKSAMEDRITLSLNLPSDLPDIWADKLRIRQVILSVLYHSLYYIPKGGKSNVSANVEELSDGTPSCLDIVISDDGFGHSEKTREEFWKERFGESDLSGDLSEYSRNPDMMKLSLAKIKHIMELHHGIFDIQAKPGKGTVFTLRLPYLSKDELEASFDGGDKSSYNSVDGKKSKNKNIISFPKGNHPKGSQ